MISFWTLLIAVANTTRPPGPDLLERGAPPEGVVGLRAHGDVRLSLPPGQAIILVAVKRAVFAAAGYNFSLLLRWFGELLRALLLILLHALLAPRFISPRAVKLSSQPTTNRLLKIH